MFLWRHLNYHSKSNKSVTINNSDYQDTANKYKRWTEVYCLKSNKELTLSKYNKAEQEKDMMSYKGRHMTAHNVQN